MSNQRRKIEGGTAIIDQIVYTRPFNTWYGSDVLSEWPSSSGVSSGTSRLLDQSGGGGGDSGVMVTMRHQQQIHCDDKADEHREYMRARRQDLSWYQALRTDESWLRLRKDHEDRQISGSIEWINQKLSRSWLEWSRKLDTPSHRYPVRSLKDMHDGVIMICLLESLYNCELKKELKCQLRLHKVRNYESCLGFMRNNRGSECVGIQSYDLVDCVNVKIMLGFLFLVKHDYECKYLNEMISEIKVNSPVMIVTAEYQVPETIQHQHQYEQLENCEKEQEYETENANKVDVESIKEVIATSKMDDSGLIIGMDTDDTSIIASCNDGVDIGNSSSNENDTYFETSSDSFSLASETPTSPVKAAAQQQQPTENQMSSIVDHGENNDDDEYDTNNNLGETSSSSSGSISEELPMAAETSSSPRVDHHHIASMEMLVTKEHIVNNSNATRRVSLTDDRFLDNSLDSDDLDVDDDENDEDENNKNNNSDQEDHGERRVEDSNQNHREETDIDECLRVEMIERHDEPVATETRRRVSGDETTMAEMLVEVRESNIVELLAPSKEKCEKLISPNHLEVATGECCSNNEPVEKNRTNEEKSTIDKQVVENKDNNKDKTLEKNENFSSHQQDDQINKKTEQTNIANVKNSEKLPDEVIEPETSTKAEPISPILVNEDDNIPKSRKEPPISREQIPIERLPSEAELQIDSPPSPTTLKRAPVPLKKETKASDAASESIVQPITLKLNVIPATIPKKQRGNKYKQPRQKTEKTEKIVANGHVIPISDSLVVAPLAVVEQVPQNVENFEKKKQDDIITVDKVVNYEETKDVEKINGILATEDAVVGKNKSSKVTKSSRKEEAVQSVESKKSQDGENVTTVANGAIQNKKTCKKSKDQTVVTISHSEKQVDGDDEKKEKVEESSKIVSKNGGDRIKKHQKETIVVVANNKNNSSKTYQSSANNTNRNLHNNHVAVEKLKSNSTVTTTTNRNYYLISFLILIVVFLSSLLMKYLGLLDN